MNIDVLVVDGCPHAGRTYDLVRDALFLEKTTAKLSVVVVEDAEAAKRLQFIGSPSVRVDGEEIEVPARERTAYGMMCRTYDRGSARAGTPPLEMIRTAIRRARATAASRCDPA